MVLYLSMEQHANKYTHKHQENRTRCLTCVRSACRASTNSQVSQSVTYLLFPTRLVKDAENCVWIRMLQKSNVIVMNVRFLG